MIIHVVKSGETLSSIARLYGVSSSAVIAANNLPNPDVLSVGQRINIPVTGTSHPKLFRGSKGTAVRELQQLLVSRGYNPGPADGVFGPMTERAVKKFQRDAGLVPDGVVGPKTWSALLAGQQLPP